VVAADGAESLDNLLIAGDALALSQIEERGTDMRIPKTPPPSDEDILGYQNVPVTVAARYIGWSSTTIYQALQEDRAPFGFAVRCKSGGWAYNISPGLLVKYRRGDLPTYRLKEVQELAAEGIERILDTRMKGLKKVVEAVL